MIGASGVDFGVEPGVGDIREDVVQVQDGGAADFALPPQRHQVGRQVGMAQKQAAPLVDDQRAKRCGMPPPETTRMGGWGDRPQKKSSGH